MIRRVLARLSLPKFFTKPTMTEQVGQAIPASMQVETRVKRSAESTQETAVKKSKPEAEAEEKPKMGEEGYVPYKKKKVALLMMYSGKGYLGMQLQSGVASGLKTIEKDLLEALVRAGVIHRDHASHPGNMMHFQRAARTDKGVSAAGQVVSFKMFLDVENPLEKINANLPPQIQVLAIKRATKNFDSKNACCGRTYMYLLPTFVFTPVEQSVTEKFRATADIVAKTNEVLALFKGTKNFHNFTAGKKPNDPSTRRYIIDFHMDEPFVRDDLEWGVIKVRGQSFMLHQIRKMIGITIAIVRGLTGIEAVQRAYGPEKCDIPKAPGLGLMLDKVHYDHYNDRFGKDGVHDAIDWDQYKEKIEKFKEEYIYSTIVRTEKEEKSMLMWMSTLHLHHLGEEQRKEELGEEPSSRLRTDKIPLLQAKLLLNKDTKEKTVTSAASSVEPSDVTATSATSIETDTASEQTSAAISEDVTDTLLEKNKLTDDASESNVTNNDEESDLIKREAAT